MVGGDDEQLAVLAEDGIAVPTAPESLSEKAISKPSVMLVA